jgi:carbonic anhydrase
MEHSFFPPITPLRLFLGLAFLAVPSGNVWSGDAHPPGKEHRAHGNPPASSASAAKSKGADHGHGPSAPGKAHGAPASDHGHSKPADPAAIAAAIESSRQGVERLRQGNFRFTSGRSERPHQGADQRELVAKGQKPFALILGCADSRVPPEILFDQGLGDLFVIRVAGNVVDDPGLGSIEYAVEHLNVKLIVVLGHERCGAVDAATKGGDPGGHIGSLVHAIAPAVEAARIKKGNLLEEAVKANVLLIVNQLKNTAPFLAPAAKSGMLTVVGAVYDLETGTADFLP